MRDANLGFAKGFWWLVFACGAGGMLLFVFFLLSGPLVPHDYLYFVWPGAALAMGFTAAINLHGCYVREPARAQGASQFMLSDLLAASLLTGTVLTICFGALEREIFLVYGISGSLASGVACVASLAAAARKGFNGSKRRHLYAAGYFVRTFGFLATGGLVFMLLMLLLTGNNPLKLVLQLFDVKRTGITGPDWLAWPYRLGLPCLILGTVSCRALERGLPKKLPPPEKDRVTSSPPDGTNGGA
ncbi:MAG: hypothetical protein L6R28_16435 [Planctomycetes bacterium]|nr:hypothetical protein [Planctomycetota bacterium]